MATGFLSVVGAVLTYYGTNAGNISFGVPSESYNKGIALCMNRDCTRKSPVLSTDPIPNAEDTTLGAIDLEDIIATDGTYQPNADNQRNSSVIGYTFYLTNSGELTLDYSYTIRIMKATRNIDAAIRVLVYEERLNQGVGYTATQYMKYETYGIDYRQYYGSNKFIEYPQEVNFLDSTTVVSKEVYGLNPAPKGKELGDVTKYTIIVWLEGNDPDTCDFGDPMCGESVRGGQLKLQMTFKVIDTVK